MGGGVDTTPPDGARASRALEEDGADVAPRALNERYASPPAGGAGGGEGPTSPARSARR